MSEHDDTLLDEDLGDEEYDLGNDEEEALLADDYEVDRQNSYKGEEETDDVLDLGVTDALDDLEENDEENIEFSKGKTGNHNEHDFYNDGDNQEDKSMYYGQNKGSKYQDGQNRQYEEDSAYEGTNSNAVGKGDLREKLQKKNYIGNGQGLEDDDGEEARERRNRFQNERTMISPKMNNEIPDSLENVVTSDSSRSPPFRHRGRGRGMRGGGRGIRFPVPNSGNYNPRFVGPRGPSFENPQAPFRPPLLENRPPFMMGMPNNVQNQQIVFQQANPQMPPYQQFPPSAPPQGPVHFVENRPPFNPNQFQGLIGPPGPRPAMNPRMEFGSRGPIQGPPIGPPYNNPHQPQYPQMQSGPFPNAGGHPQDSQGRPGPMQGPGPGPGPMLHGNPGGSLLGNPPMSGNPVPMLPGNQAHPNQGFPPRQPAPTPGAVMQNHPNAPIPGQTPFENRPPFQEAIFEGRPYEQRPPYTEPVPNNQFSNNALPPLPQQPGSNVPNVPLPPGHKILINPHFRGTVQPTPEARLAWDMAQHQAPSQPTNSQFIQPPSSYQNQGPYNQTQQGSADYKQQNYQQNKSDDPYAYFSDVWQENKPQKSQNSPNKQYLADNSYSRDSNYDSSSKYKFDGSWERNNYQEEQKGSHQNYRDRDFPSRTRNDNFSKTSSSGTYRKDSYEQSHPQRTGSRPTNSNTRGISKPAPKRLSPEPHEKGQHESSPKRMKSSSRNLQEVRRVDSSSNATEEKIDEDSDPEMLEYRKKMEEQKRLREKILREKENRRKKAALEKQSEESKMDTNTAANDSHQEVKTASVLTGVVKEDTANKGRATVCRGRGRSVNAQATEVIERPIGGRIVRTNAAHQSNESSNSGKVNENCGMPAGQTNDSGQVKPSIGQSTTRRVVIQKPLTTTQKVPTTIHKAILNIQKGQTNMQNRVNTYDAVQKVTQKQAAVLKRSVMNTQRGNAQKGQGSLQKTVINVQNVANANAQKIIVNTQNNQRVVLQKSTIQTKKAPDIKTNTVKLENLAASTSETQIRRMCQGIGTIESIHMGEGTATIVFKTQSAAMVFHKKYQRKMLDLSLITVRLIPQSGGNKTVSTVTSG